MKPTPGVWGLDLGQCALKALRLQEIDGQLTATAFDYVEYPKILSQPDADADQLTREALEQFLSRNTLRGDIVAIAVPGQSGLARFVKLPPVEEKKIADIVKFEAKQQIPFNLDEVVWDYQKIGSGEVIDGLALETEVGLFAMKRDLVKRYLDHFKEVGVEVHVIQMAPLALCNYLAFDLLNRDANAPPLEGKQPCAVGLDIGTDSSNLVITDGGKIIWQRPIPLGGNHFTRALTKDLKLTFAKAEHLKRNATKSGAAELKKILGSLKPVLNDFVGEVQRSLGYFTNTHRDAQVEFMVGLGNAFRLPGMQRFLAEKLQLEVRKIDKMNRLVGDSVASSPIYQENILSFGVAYGLCLQGLQRARLVTNLLPHEIRLERLVRAKKPWAVAASALLLVGLGSAALGNYLNERPYSAPAVEAEIKRSDAAAKAASSALAKFNTTKEEATKEEEAVKSIVAGQAERTNWLKLLKFIADAVPQPDAKNLSPEQKAAFFDSRQTLNRRMSGKEAYDEYKNRTADAVKPPSDDAKDVDPLPIGIDDLIQYNIESVDARFCDDLNAFWKEATKDRDPSGADVRPTDHYKKVLPEGKGWVVEVAGYTYHNGKDAFVRNTLLANLARMGVKTTPAPAAGEAGGNAAAPKGGAAEAPPAAPDAKKDDTREPVVGRISHVLLYKAQAKPVVGTGGFEHIDKGVLDALVGAKPGGGAAGAGGPGGMPGGPAMPGAGGMMGGGMMGGGMMGGGMGGGQTGGGDGAPSKPSRSSWVGLSSRAGAAAAGGAGGGMFGGSGSSLGPSLPGGGPMPGSGPGGPGAGGKTQTVANPGNHQRTEFIILFIWKEPTPSDALRGTEDGGAAPEGAPK